MGIAESGFVQAYCPLQMISIAFFFFAIALKVQTYLCLRSKLT